MVGAEVLFVFGAVGELLELRGAGTTRRQGDRGSQKYALEFQQALQKSLEGRELQQETTSSNLDAAARKKTSVFRLFARGETRV